MLRSRESLVSPRTFVYEMIICIARKLVQLLHNTNTNIGQNIDEIPGTNSRYIGTVGSPVPKLRRIDVAVLEDCGVLAIDSPRSVLSSHSASSRYVLRTFARRAIYIIWDGRAWSYSKISEITRGRATTMATLPGGNCRRKN